MNYKSTLMDLIWRPEGLCVNLGKWHRENPGAVRENSVNGCVELVPEPNCNCYVADLTDGKVIGDAKLVATTKNMVLGDVQFLFGSTCPEGHWILKQRRLRIPERLVGTAVVVASSNAENYFHWLFDSLPRLLLLELAGYAINQVDYFLLDHSRRSFQTESLNHFGIPESKLRRCSKRRVLECERLVVPSMPGPLGRPPKWVCKFLRDRFVADPSAMAERKIYISRQQARGRKILNEGEILPVLVRHGYEIVHAENLTFLQQVQTFAAAKAVIAVHGAGMSNIVFARPGTRVLELGSLLHNNDSFSTLAANCDLDYHHLYLDSAAGAGNDDTRFANVVVDPLKFERTLEAIAA